MPGTCAISVLLLLLLQKLLLVLLLSVSMHAVSPSFADSAIPPARARSLHMYLSSFKTLSASAALKRPLLQKQTMKKIIQAAIHEDGAAGTGATALCSACALFAVSAGGGAEGR